MSCSHGASGGAPGPCQLVAWGLKGDAAGLGPAPARLSFAGVHAGAEARTKDRAVARKNGRGPASRSEGTSVMGSDSDGGGTRWRQADVGGLGLASPPPGVARVRAAAESGRPGSAPQVRRT